MTTQQKRQDPDTPAVGAESEYILLPPSGLRTSAGPEHKLFTQLPYARSVERPRYARLEWRTPGAAWDGLKVTHLKGIEPPSPQISAVHVRVIDTVGENGPKLVAMSAQSALALKLADHLVRVVPNRRYQLLQTWPDIPLGTPPSAATAPPTVIQVVAGNLPVQGLRVTAITDLRARLGDESTTDSTGTVRLRLGQPPAPLEQLHVNAPARGYWGAFASSMDLPANYRIDLTPVDLGARGSLQHFYAGTSSSGDGSGVRVAVVDSGIDASHPDLSVYDGINTVTGEPANEYGDNGLGHGTHVAGIIGAHGKPPTGMRGLAPAVQLVSCRVYPADATSASGYAVMKGLMRAVDRGCHVINLSLGNMDPDESLREAVQDATDHGAIVISAAGNGYGQPVSVPAAYAIAVSAMGRKGTFPEGVREAGDVGVPIGADPDNFFATFSNFGSDVDLVAPGVGIVSTVPGGYAPGRGTSMAAAAASGIAARLLTRRPDLLNAAPDRRRAVEMQNHVMQLARSLGFGLPHEGYGML